MKNILILTTPTKYSPCVGIRTCSDYSPFGVELDGRTVSNYGYRFGYQGSEKDNELKGDGNSYTTEFRQLDPRLGRWLSVDPVIQPWQSAYCSMDGNPIGFSDILGSNTTDWIRVKKSKGGKSYNEPVFDSGIHDDESARKKYGNDAYIIKDGFEFTTIGGNKCKLMEGGNVIIDGRSGRVEDLNSTKINLLEDHTTEKEEDNSIARELLGASNTKHHNDWHRDPSKHHYMYDFDNSFQKGFTLTMLGATTGLLALEVAPLAIGAYSYIGNTSVSNLGVNYLSESISNGSLNPLDHNSLSYLYAGISAGMSAGTISVSQEIFIGASSGVVECNFNDFKLKGIWNQNLAVTTLKVINGATAPFYGKFYGDLLRQGLGGYGINELAKDLN